MPRTSPSAQDSAPQDAPATDLNAVLFKSEHVKELVEEAAVELALANVTLQQEFVSQKPTLATRDALAQTAAVEDKVEEASEVLSQVTHALAAEVEERGALDRKLSVVIDQASTKEAIASLQLAAIVKSSTDAIISKDLNGVITSWNGGAEKIFGYSAAEMVGSSILRLVPADRQDEERGILEAVRRGEITDHLETRRVTKDGRTIAVSVTTSPIKDATGRVVGASKIARDITALTQTEIQNRALLLQQLTEATEQGKAARHAALHDALTGLPNRALFRDRLEHGLAQARRHARALAVMFLDLDGFKAVNDTHGHAAGDAVLRIVAARLAAMIRDDDTICRLGGDEFLYLLMEVPGQPEIAAIADKLAKAVALPCEVSVGGRTLALPVAASIGIALFPGHGATPDALIASADAAMYSAKRDGRRYSFAR